MSKSGSKIREQVAHFLVDIHSILVGTTCPWLMRRWKIEFNMVQLSADFFELDEFTSAPPHG
jgi:hypothetical protein